MKVFYTLKENIYNAADVDLALQCAEVASKNYGWQVSALIETQAQKCVFVGVPNFTFSGTNRFKYNSITGDIITRRQYKGVACEIIVAVCPTIQLLQAVQQNSMQIQLLIVVPEMDANACRDIYHWLDLYSAFDIQSGQSLQGIHQPAVGIKRAIGYLIDYCHRITVDMTHTPLYTGEIADVANTLKERGIIANYEEVVKYSLTKGLSYNESEILAKAFSQKSHLKMRGIPNYDRYWQNINDSMWD